MPNDVYAQFGVPAVINCVGYATRVGGSRPSEPILRAMHAASRTYVEMDDLLAAASRQIALSTGAEAGLVTCGAAAGLTLAAAACLAGSNVVLMDRLPDTAGFARNEIIYPRGAAYDYDHAVRSSGARLITIDYHAADALAQIEAAIGPRTVAIGYAWQDAGDGPDLTVLASLAHRHGLPFLVDGAKSLPPADNLRHFIRCGADLVTFSGGKHLGGPQGSGILCGRADLIRSAWVQMADMDVRPGTWSLQHWVDQGWMTGPPRHGIGRSMKIGKESIVGLMLALDAYDRRDFASEARVWGKLTDKIAVGLVAVPGLAVAAFPSGPTGQPFPFVRLRLDSAATGIAMPDLIQALRQHRPKIILAEHETDRNEAMICPVCLSAPEAKQVVAAITQIMGAITKG